MVRSHYFTSVLFLFLFFIAGLCYGDQAGGIRGMVYDKDFSAPVAGGQVMIAETGESVEVSDEGNYVFGEVKPGNYTLVFSKEGYTRQVKADVVVSGGQMTEVDAYLTGEFTEMEEFVVQDVQIGAGTEAILLDLRMESPALLDSISAELMSQAGASDAASALKLVSGATVQEGKYAVIRGLPDRYVNSQLNGIRLPTADADKRAVQLDQFPASVIESMQVSKTFTPDQQGDASGGAVNVVLKGIPDETVFKINTGSSYNMQWPGKGDFLTSNEDGVNMWGERDYEVPIDSVSDGKGGVFFGDKPFDYKWSITGGGKYELDSDVKIGGLGSFYYERDTSYHEDGIEDKYWVENPGDPMTPQYGGQDPPGASNDFQTSLFDVKESKEEVKWGGLGVVGIETEKHALQLLYMYTRAAENKVTLAEDTRGRAFYLQEYGASLERQAAPFLRSEKAEYIERITETFQISGKHTLPFPEIGIEKLFVLREPEIEWAVSQSYAGLNQPDKRLFSTRWLEAHPTFPDLIPASHNQWISGANINFGNFHRIWKKITEESDQYNVNFKFPFEQWSGDEGYAKFGIFNDEVKREYNQDSFANSEDGTIKYDAPWGEYWSRIYYELGYISNPDADIDAANIDVDYKGEQNISAWYYMLDFPLTSFFKFVGGTRFESTELSITNDPDPGALLVFQGSGGPALFDSEQADVTFEQEDVLPSLGFEFAPFETVTFRGSYTETVARQTFKELSPIMQQDYLGGDVFIGYNDLKMSALKNYDLRFDYNPYEGGLVSVSYFRKKIDLPIEYVQMNAGFSYTTPVNYPEGQLEGWEFEIRQRLGHFIKSLEGLSVGANATFIESEVTLPDDEAAEFEADGFPMTKRDMMNAPEHLYNLYLTYDITPFTKFGVFYTVRGDTLVAGAGQSGGNYIPSVYETEYGTLNMSLSHKIGDIWGVKLQAKNILNPDIESVYRSDYIGDDVRKTSYKKGVEFSLSVGASF